MDELTDAEAAFKLYSWLDSSGGDFSDVQNGLESVRHDRFTDEENHTFERICRYINHADDSLSEAMEQLDTVLTDESVEERNDTHVFTDSVSDRDIRTTQTLVSHALEDIGLCVNDLGVKAPRHSPSHSVDLIDEIEIPVDNFTETHDTLEDAISYLYSDCHRMNEYAKRMN